MVLAVPPNHRLAQRKAVGVHELSDERFVSFDPDLSIRKAIDRFLRQHDVDVEVVYEFDNIENLKRAVEVAVGVSILPMPTLSQELQSGKLVAVRIESDDPQFRLTRPLAIIHKRQHNLNPTATRFLELLRGDEASGPASHPPLADNSTTGRRLATARA